MVDHAKWGKRKDFGSTVVTFITTLEHWLHSLHVARSDSKKEFGGKKEKKKGI